MADKCDILSEEAQRAQLESASDEGDFSFILCQRPVTWVTEARG